MKCDDDKKLLFGISGLQLFAKFKVNFFTVHVREIINIEYLIFKILRLEFYKYNQVLVSETSFERFSILKIGR